MQAVLGLAGLVGGFGLGTAAVRRLSVLFGSGQRREGLPVAGSLVTVNLLAGSALASALVAIFPLVFTWSKLAPDTRLDAKWATVWIASGLVVGLLDGSCQSVLQAAQRFDLLAVLNTVAGLLVGSCGIVVLKLWPSMAAVALSNLVIAVLRLLAEWVLAGTLLRGALFPPMERLGVERHARVRGLDLPWQSRHRAVHQRRSPDPDELPRQRRPALLRRSTTPLPAGAYGAGRSLPVSLPNPGGH